MSLLQVVREHCFECQGFNGQGSKPVKAVRECPNRGCRFYPYRMGRRPDSKGGSGDIAEKRKRALVETILFG
ncbi:MAG: hypothetical protein CVU57_20345 [Deltaproteobacteria bacterium HGW-Deltaproteobacteria-15]|jgi:hypothetical protein|nr:MAG: hypothetical protein CVU57_20345 [Deltaproteobacteria bacterium HGW-Deltaproteobacteria-15]